MKGEIYVNLINPFTALLQNKTKEMLYESFLFIYLRAPLFTINFIYLSQQTKVTIPSASIRV